VIRPFKEFVRDKFNLAINPAPVGFPRPAIAGILHEAGFDATQVIITIDRPARNIDASKANLVINVPTKNDVKKTFGPGAPVETTIALQLDLLWIADFSPDLETGTPADYSDETLAGEDFDTFIEIVENAVALILAEYSDSQLIPENQSWQITSQRTGRSGWINGVGENVTTDTASPTLAENGQDVTFAAMVTAYFKLKYYPAQRPV
jgi:hypothetical protein